MLFQEIRHAFRALGKNRGFTAVAALSLALGIGANSAIFSLADALLLRPLPVVSPSRVVTVNTSTPDNPYDGVSYPDYRDLREKSQSFEGLVAYQLATWGLATSADAVPQVRMGMMVSDNFFPALRVEPALGRAFLADEAKVPGRDAIALLGYEFWEDQYAGDKSVIGRTLRLNGIDFTIVGVTPKSFTGLDQFVRPAVFVPVSMWARLSTTAKTNPLEDRSNRGLQMKGRLKPGVSKESAQAELATLAKALEQAYPSTNPRRTVTVDTELEARIHESPPDAMLVAMLMALVALVLLIACANVANLLLARARSRSREVAIRLAIGAGRVRLMRQLLLESVAVSLLGATLGIGVAYAGISFLQTIKIPTDLPIVIGIHLDLRVLLFSLGAAVISALAAGVIPAWKATNTEMIPALKAGERGSTGGRRTIGRNVLVVGQIALAMVLLVAAGMLIDGFRKTMVLNPGFRTDHLITMDLDPSLVRYTRDQARDFYRTLGDRARVLPGVRAAAFTRSVPFSNQQSAETLIPEGYQFPKDQESVSLFTNVVDEHYFGTMKTEIVQGRGFTAGDKADARRVAIVNQDFAKTYWPNQDPIGKRFRLDSRSGPMVEVVGIARDGKYLFIAEPPMAYVYLPLAQNPRIRMTLVVETLGDPAEIATPLRQLVRTLDENLPVYNLRTLSSFYEMRALATTRIIMQLVMAMGLMGLTLALVGLYGLIAYSVSRRTQEIGIRIAIGAARTDVLRMVLRQGFILAAAGIAVGSIASFGVARLLTVGLAGLGVPNPLTYVIVPVALFIATMMASFIPARRASNVDPIRALRYE